MPVFNTHNEVIIAWGELRRTLREAPRVWTIDFHPDTMPSFRGSRELPSADIFADHTAIAVAAAELRHDEHFDWALHAGIIAGAEILSFMVPPAAAHPELRVHAMKDFPELNEFLNNSAKYRAAAVAVLSDENLKKNFPLLPPGKSPFILDIDCDAILCAEALELPSGSLFRRWLASAALVTISKENDWVKLLRLPGEKITGDSIAAVISNWL